MKVYGSNAIRNVAFVGHGASGKTTLVDALAFVSGTSRRHGSVKDGTTLTDYTPDEIERKHSIGLSVAYAEWMDVKLNLIDTPGYLDFFGEAVTGLHTADSAVVVISATGGVEVGTEKVWEVCDRLHLPRIIFVSQMDKEHANFERVFQDIKEHLSPKVVPVEIPLGDGPQFRGVMNLFSGKHPHLQEGHQDRRVRRIAAPRGIQGTVLPLRPAADRGCRLERRQPARALSGRRGNPPGGSARRHEAGDAAGGDRAALLRKRRSLPTACGRCSTRWSSCCRRRPRFQPRPTAPLVGHVFKTISEPHVGDVTLFRIYTGTIKNGEEVWNAEHSVAEKLNHLSVQQGKERFEVPELAAGDIGSVAKLKDTHTNDTFCRRESAAAVASDPVSRSPGDVGRGGEDAG